MAQSGSEHRMGLLAPLQAPILLDQPYKGLMFLVSSSLKHKCC